LKIELKRFYLTKLSVIHFRGCP